MFTTPHLYVFLTKRILLPLAWSVQNSGCGSQSYSGFLPEVRGGCRQGQQALGTLTDLLAWPPWQPMGTGFGHQLQGGEGGSGPPEELGEASETCGLQGS